jgi:threonine/homoserine/homoserine lactone efflux protein
MIVFTVDILKSYLANRLRKILRPELIRWLNRIVGIMLVGFALRLFYYAMESYWYLLAAL